MEVCASVLAQACQSAAGEVVAANEGAADSPCPSAQESCIDVARRERSSQGAKRPEAPAGSGAQSVPGTWGPSRRGINRKQMRTLLSPVSLEWEWKAQEGGDLPHD